jgi:hypothetical protein
MAAVDLAAGFGGVKVMRPAVGVEAHRQAVLPNTSFGARKVEAVPSSATRNTE